MGKDGKSWKQLRLWIFISEELDIKDWNNKKRRFHRQWLPWISCHAACSCSRKSVLNFFFTVAIGSVFFFLIDTLIFFGKINIFPSYFFSILFIFFFFWFERTILPGFSSFYIYIKGHNSFLTSETKLNKIKYFESLPMVMMFDS